MDAVSLESRLLTYVATEMLHGAATDLTVSTPLLALGIIDSFSVLTLLAFAEREFGTAIPLEEVSAEDMKDISHIAALIGRRSAPSGVVTTPEA